MSAALTDLLDSLGGLPVLPGARCRHRWELFDATIHEGRGAPTTAVLDARNEALAICNSCPALAACAAWVESLPPRHRPHGVIAGQVRASQPARPRKAAT